MLPRKISQIGFFLVCKFEKIMRHYHLYYQKQIIGSNSLFCNLKKLTVVVI